MAEGEEGGGMKKGGEKAKRGGGERKTHERTGKETEGVKKKEKRILKSRGRIEKGFAADFAIFDLNTIGSQKRGEMRNDLPGGGRRLVMPAEGVIHTVVNGTVLYQDQKHTGDLPGQVLRSGLS